MSANRISIGLSIVARLLLVMTLVSCGGAHTLDPGGGGTGNRETTTAVGPITGFGSVIVNGVIYDDSPAIVTTEDGRVLSRSELRLGMMVEVMGSTDRSNNTGTATTITAFSEIKGLVDSVTIDGVLVNGVNISFTAQTIYDDVGMPVVGDYVEIYGIYDPSVNAVVATRVERKNAANFKLRGQVSNWNSATQQFVLGTILVSYAGTALPTGFENGISVRAESLSEPGAGAWPVADIRLAENGYAHDGDRIEIEAVVTAFTSVANFEINGLPVNATSAVFQYGTANELAVGRRVEVEGNMEAGALVATVVEFEDGEGADRGDGGRYELTGRISEFSSLMSFYIRGTRVDASHDPDIRDGLASQIANDVCVELRGYPFAEDAGTVVRATRIRFRDDCG